MSCALQTPSDAACAGASCTMSSLISQLADADDTLKTRAAAHDQSRQDNAQLTAQVVALRDELREMEVKLTAVTSQLASP